MSEEAEMVISVLSLIISIWKFSCCISVLWLPEAVEEVITLRQCEREWLYSRVSAWSLVVL